MSICLERDFWIYLIITLLVSVIGIYFLTQEIQYDQIALSFFWLGALFLSLALLACGMGTIPTLSCYITVMILYFLILAFSLIWVSSPTSLAPVVLLILLNLLMYLMLGQDNRVRSSLMLAIMVVWLGLAIYIMMEWYQLL